MAPPPPSFADRLGMRLDDVTRHVGTMGLRANAGAVVLAVTPGGTAHLKKIRRGDVIRQIARQRIRRVADVLRVAKTLRPGQKIFITVQRKMRFIAIRLKY